MVIETKPEFATTATPVFDQAARSQALDPSQSFIVQAPAGSGKTELLTQRVLLLLSHAEQNPEEVVAITFTRKAAFEMRARIISALETAHHGTPPTDAHALQTYHLARAVLQRDQELGWQLLANPNRLRTTTIDSLCARITSQMPIVTGLGAQPRISDDCHELYQQAARQCIASLDSNQPWVEALAMLLEHLDNDIGKVERLLMAMLATRDQWLSHVIDRNPREHLERALQIVISECLQELSCNLPINLQQELLELIAFAKQHIEPDSEFSTLIDIIDLPEVGVHELTKWQTLASLLLTKDFNFRKQVTTKQGFPAPSNCKDKELQTLYKQMKQRMLTLLAELADDEILRQQLQTCLQLPPPYYNDQQWQIIEALVELLPITVALLQLLFKEYGVVDHTEITLKAIAALGNPDAPTDLALRLDYQIRHLLIDEFQDTSLVQFRLLEQLTAGWQGNDGRTLFLVGDPMQSIYRFRKAEVGLFLQAQETGVGQIKLTPLQLGVNFRSEPGIIDWVNQTFVEVLPKQDDLASGAIRFAASKAHKQNQSLSQAIYLHPHLDEQQDLAPQTIVNIIQHTKTVNPNATIGLLVMARSHLLAILPMLKQANIPYRAIEIETLGHRMLVQDLFSLTKALLHPGDRLAWLAILRAPWAGILLADLLTIVGEDQQATIWQLLQTTPHENLSADAKVRLERIIPIFTYALRNRRRLPLAKWLEQTWQALGGPACVSEASDLADARAYFNLVTELSEGGDIVDFERLERRLFSLAANIQEVPDNAVDVMTIHKAKGLEFDVVILPALERASPSDRHQLLLWQEFPTRRGSTELIMAPIKREKQDAIYDYLRIVEQQKANHELSRLLYVAATRAKMQLHLLAGIQSNPKVDGDDNLFKTPTAGSPLAKLWPIIQGQLYPDGELVTQFVPAPGTNLTPEDEQPIAIRRLKNSWQAPVLHAVKAIDQPPPEDYSNDLKNNFVKPWQFDPARHIGILIHRLFYLWSQQSGIDSHKIKHDLMVQFQTLGASAAELEQLAKTIDKTIFNIKNDPKAQWILSAHEQAYSELALSTIIDKKVQHLIIDRTFIADGKRWIIDYKTAEPDPDVTDIDKFLVQEYRRHQQQLQQYAMAFHGQGQYPIRLGLYFPLLPAWYEWSYEG